MVTVYAISFGPPIQTQSRNIGWQFLATAGGFGLILDSTQLDALMRKKPMYHVLGLGTGGALVPSGRGSVGIASCLRTIDESQPSR
jgi:hypothetical protein